jgi:hypothetical protein
MDLDLDEFEGFLDDIEDDTAADAVIADSQPTLPRVFSHVLIPEPKKSFKRAAYRAIEGENSVMKVLEEEVEDEGDLWYMVRYGDMRHEKVSWTSVCDQEGVSARQKRR